MSRKTKKVVCSASYTQSFFDQFFGNGVFQHPQAITLIDPGEPRSPWYNAPRGGNNGKLGWGRAIAEKGTRSID
jgi:hypothetical protein